MVHNSILREISQDDVKSHLQQAGDLGTVIAHGSWEVPTYLELETVYDRLVAFEQISGVGSQEEKIQYLQSLLRDVTPGGAKYLVRMVLGKLRLGFSEMTVIDALSWVLAGSKEHRDAIEYAFNICADIGKIAYVVIANGVQGLEHIDIQVGIPVRMAAAERLASLDAIIDRIGTCVVQPKLDGFRLQVHIQREGGNMTISFFSRNLANMSHMFPDVQEALQHVLAESLIIEGEAIAYDISTDSYLPFQETVKRRRKYGIEEAVKSYPLYFMVFDILYQDGTSVLDYPHTRRRQILRRLFDVYPDQRVQLVDEQEVHNVQELTAYFQNAITAGLEGVVVRRPEAAYQPGKRNYNWIKFKRRQANRLADTIDCVVLGYYYGHGRRAKFGIGAFLVGIYNDQGRQFQTIAKVGTGLTDAGWHELKRICDMHTVAEQPSTVSCHGDLAPDVWVAPEVVVVVAADEITESPLHTAGRSEEHAGLALRFPRFIAYRPDKEPVQATSIQEIRGLYQQQ